MWYVPTRIISAVGADSDSSASSTGAEGGVDLVSNRRPQEVSVIWSLWLNAVHIRAEKISSEPIRILDSVQQPSSLRPVLYQLNTNYDNPYIRAPSEQSFYNQYGGPTKSYVIYDGDPRRIVASKAPDTRGQMYGNPQQWHLEFNKQWRPVNYNDDYKYYQNPDNVPKSSVSYQSVFSNTIKVYEDPANEYPGDYPYRKPYASKKYTGVRDEKSPYTVEWSYSHAVPNYDVHYPYEVSMPNRYTNDKVPDNFPTIFAPNKGFQLAGSNNQNAQAAKSPNSNSNIGLYHTRTVNFYDYPNPNDRYTTRAEVSNLDKPSRQSHGKQFLCNYIRVNEQDFPEGNKLCSRSEDAPLISPEYPYYPGLPVDKIPMEHRRHNEPNRSVRRERRSLNRDKRTSGYGFNTWRSDYSPYNYDRSYGGYYNDYNYPSYGSYGTYGNSYGSNSFDNYGNYGNNRNRGYSNNRNHGYNNMYEYDDQYRNSEETTNHGLTSFLARGGRREGNRNRNSNSNSNSNSNGNSNSNSNLEEDDDNLEENSEEDERRDNGRRREQSDKRNNGDEKNSRGNRYGMKRDQDRSHEDQDEDNRGRYGSRGRPYGRRNEDRYGSSDYGGSRYRGGYGGGGYGGRGSSGYGSYGNRNGMNSNGRNYGGYGGSSSYLDPTRGDNCDPFFIV